MALTKVSSSLVSDNAVTSGKIADGGIATADIADVAVTTAKIANNAILTQHIDDGQVTTAQLGADAVTADKIANDAISEEHLDVTVITSLSAVTAATGDLLMVADVSDSNNLKKIPVSSILAGTHTGAVNTSSGVTSTSAITAASGGNAIQLGTDGNIEITRTSGSAYIDFKNSTSEDFDQRIQANSTGLTFSGTISSGAITSTGAITSSDFFKATGGNLKFSAGGTHIFNVDLNGKIYPQTHNSVDLGFSDSLAFRNLRLVGAMTGGATISSGAITTSGDIIGTNGTFRIKGAGDVEIHLDDDSNNLSSFIIKNGANNSAFSLTEAGAATFAGTISAPLSYIGSGSFPVTPNTNGDDLVIFGSGSHGISILSGTSGDGNIFFGDSGGNVRGKLAYSHNGDYMTTTSAGAYNILGGGEIKLDAGGDIILDADGGDIVFRDGGASKLFISNSSDDVLFTNAVQDKDLIFKGYDGTSLITALTLDMSAAGEATFAGGISNDGVGKFYSWRPVGNTGGSGIRYVKICRVTAGAQSARFRIDLAGRNNSYGDTSRPAMGTLVGQLNNDNNYDLTYYDFHPGTASAGANVVLEIAQVDIDTVSTDIYIKIQDFSEILATASMSHGSIVTTSASGSSIGSSSSPSGYAAVTSQRVLIETTDGRVGIGTPTPTSKLHIKASTNGYDGGILIEDTDSSTKSGITHVNGGLYLSSNTTTDHLFINSAGDILIGNTTVQPSSNHNNQAGFGYDRSTSQLQIASTTNNAPMELSRNSSNDGNWITFRKQSNILGNLGTYGGTLYVGSTNGGIMFNGTDIEPTTGTTTRANNTVSLGSSNYKFKNLQLHGSLYAHGGAFVIDQDGGGTFLGKSDNSTLRLITNNTERMRITNDGKINIGTTSTAHDGKFNLAGTGDNGIQVYMQHNETYVVGQLIGSAGVSTKTATLVFQSNHLRAQTIEMETSGHKYNNGADFWHTRHFYTCMSEGSNTRLNGRISNHEFEEGGTNRMTTSLTKTSGSDVWTAVITISGEYQGNFHFRMKGFGAVNCPTSLTLA